MPNDCAGFNLAKIEGGGEAAVLFQQFLITCCQLPILVLYEQIWLLTEKNIIMLFYTYAES